MKLFLTGGTGSVGLEMLRLLLRQRGDAEGRVLIRANSAAELETRWMKMLSLALGRPAVRSDAPGLRPVSGDITQPGLAMAAADAAWLRDEATHVLHSAASTDFNALMRDIYPVNVEGTRHALAAAATARRLQAFGHVSTLYVAGRRTGRIMEADLDHDAGFVNAYEESKYEAEQLVRSAMRHIPAGIYRLSLLLGRASDGYVHNVLEAHKLFELFLSGRCRHSLGEPTHTLDMLPTDYAGEILYRLFVDHFQPSGTFHISAGDSAPTGAEMSEIFRRHLGDPGWSVDWLSESQWQSIRERGNAEEYGLSAAAQWMFEIVGDYMLKPKIFDRTRTDRHLGAASLPPPRLADYLPGILTRSMAEDWGRASR